MRQEQASSSDRRVAIAFALMATILSLIGAHYFAQERSASPIRFAASAR